MVEITIFAVLLLFVAAILAGGIGALFGVGGGIVIVPFLTAVLGIPIHQAIAISIISVIATSNAGGSGYVEQRITNIRLAMFLEISTTLGALAGAVIALFLRSWMLFLLFGILFGYVALDTFRTTKKDLDHRSVAVEQDRISKYLGLQAGYYDEAARREVNYKVTGGLKGSLISGLAGVVSGLLGIGGGVIKVGAMNTFMKVPLKAAIATSKFEIGVTAVTGALLFFVSGIVNIYLVAPVALGTTLGATLGTRVMNKIRSDILKVAFALLLAYSAYTMFAQGFHLLLGV